jgi:hypothetical protein
MKPLIFLLAGLLGNALAGNNYSSPHATHQRFSVLERRARELDKSTALVKRNDFTCGPGSMLFTCVFPHPLTSDSDI